jgi:hypothetical protein
LAPTGDLFNPAALIESDYVAPALEAEGSFHATG